MIECLTAAEYSAALGLPTSPADPIYQQWLDEIEREADDDIRIDLFRLRCEDDLWFYCWRASAMRDYRIKEPGHSNFGKLWIEEPVLFYLCREYQYNIENRIEDPFYNLSREMKKTTIITVHGTVWETLRDSSMTTIILTWKVEQLAAKMYSPIKSELETNPILSEHWPDVIWQPGETPDLSTRTMLNVKRKAGMMEPTVSIHGMDSIPASYHARRIKGDDCITQDAVRTARSKREALRTLRRATALGSEDTLSMWIGTIWDPTDPNMQLLAEGFFTKRILVPAFSMDPPEYVNDSELIERGVPNLHTKDFWARWVRKLGPDETACQLQQLPRAHGDRVFETEWLLRAAYYEAPAKRRHGLHVYFIIDQAGEGDDSDHFVIRVVGLHHDRVYIELDMWRETGLKAEDFFLLLFGPEEGQSMPSWVPPEWDTGLVEKWEPRVVYVEEYSTGLFGSIRAEMTRRGFHFALRKLPTIKRRSKEGRIKLLAMPYQRGEFQYPAHGYGHGSRHSKVDVFTQYLHQEVGVWVPEPDVNEFDGGLDSEAWLIQPETKNLFVFPRRIVRQEPQVDRMTLQQLHDLKQGDDDLMTPPSPWVA